jgi:DNA-binding SARP family transcriptional activator
MNERADETPCARGGPPRVTVQGGFGVQTSDGAGVIVVGEGRRLLALLALADGRLPRALVAGTLWPDVNEHRSHSSLRSALARLPTLARGLLDVTHVEVGLGADVVVDVRVSRALAHRLLDGSPPRADLTSESVRMLSSDLLPGLYDSWVLFKGEDWRQLRMHALESLADYLVTAGRFGIAAAAALAAIQADPLRESGHAALIRVHFAEGNQSDALRQFERYRTLLRTELGLEPTERLTGLMNCASTVMGPSLPQSYARGR